MKNYYSIRMRASKEGLHISGAEGIYEKVEVIDVVQKYAQRAISHEKGRAEEINITVEEIKERPLRISSLPLCTINTRTAETARKASVKILSSVGITKRAVEEAFKSLQMGVCMRGAMLLDIEGVRLEPDLLRGVRASRMGTTKKAMLTLSKKLSPLSLNTDTVKEALILASKVSNHPMVLGELCISDDPNYTTGYVATKTHGYIRLPNIKKRGIPYGGRAFFITGGEVKGLIEYLEKTPVLINRICPCRATVPLEEILEGKTHS
ncbi:MAG: 6-carboxyhexanoate--CoA ligase [Nitrospirae bacterium]|nr:6-carboxyhexanoate--CoA ligase [Nitrospirota bacterium]